MTATRTAPPASHVGERRVGGPRHPAARRRVRRPHALAPGRRQARARPRRRPRRRAGARARAVTAPAWEEPLAELLRFLRRRLTGDYEVDDFGFDPDLTDNVLLPRAAAALREVVPRRDERPARTCPTTAARCVVANHSGTLPLDALMTAVALHDDHPAQRHLRMLGADLVFELPGRRAAGPQDRRHAGLQRRRRAAAVRRASSSASGPRASRASASRSASATSCSASAAAASSRRRCAPGCRSSRARSSAPRRSTR